jgi:phosphoribosylformimino-5-aminoimidazole carboxamide ribonucleotide (ProFAR) isomerase
VAVRGGRVATAGWNETIDGGAQEIIRELAGKGASKLVYTNVDRDGMLEGPDLEEVASVAAIVPGTFVYSGGIGALVDLESLAGLGASALAGVIVGKALYEKRFTVAEALAVLDGPSS